MKKRKKYEIISFSKTDLKIPSVAEKVILTEKLFNELKKSGDNPEMSEHHHCCGYERYGNDYWKYTCWIDFYAEGQFSMSKETVWRYIHSEFEIFSDKSRKYPIAYRHYDKRRKQTYIYIIGRCFGGMDYIITVDDKKPELKIPYDNFMMRYNKNAVPLSDILKKS